MSRKRFENMNCSVAQALEVLGDWWTLLIIRECFLGTRRFSDFEKHLGIAKNILSNRLLHLVENNILEKIEVQQRGSRYEYQLTAQGKDLYTTISAIRQWSDKWIIGKGNEPLLVKDSRTGKPIPPVKVLDSQGKVIKQQYLRVEPGPGADKKILDRFNQQQR